MSNTVVIGISGCIAAYKAANIIRMLREKRIPVVPAMTRNARNFATPLTIQTLAGNPVILDTFDLDQRGYISHITLQEEGRLLLVAPASANIIGKFANGIADDFLSTMFVAFKGPVLLAPAMNEAMYLSPSVQRNIKRLQEWGVHFVGPVIGRLATGITGVGRLAPEEQIVERCLGLMQGPGKRDLEGVKVLVTAGPTCEDLDSVRFLTNRSSGKMGYALATAACDRGADVTLVSGPVAIPPPFGVRFIGVRSAEQMFVETMEHFKQARIVLMCAAVADYTAKSPFTGKLRKGEGPLKLELARTRDVLVEMGKAKRKEQVLVGFAAEDSDDTKKAIEKLQSKACDYLVVNNIMRNDVGFDQEYNEVKVLSGRAQHRDIPRLPKTEVAHKILDAIMEDMPA